MEVNSGVKQACVRVNGSGVSVRMDAIVLSSLPASLLLI